MIRVKREAAAGTKRDPRVSWFVMLDAVIPLSQVAQHYGRRFSQEHGYRFLSSTCFGRGSMSARLNNLNAGVGCWCWCLTSCIWLVPVGKPCIGRGNTQTVP